MIIQHNIQAINVHRNMMARQKLVSKHLARLSSGSRINSAADDAAGLGISEKMRAQLGGLRMAVQNSQGAVAMLQTAEGGLSEVHAMMQRMRELAVQAANGTYSDEDRALISKEYEALKEEINRVASYTNYNNIKLLDGSLGGNKGAAGVKAMGADPDSAVFTGTEEGVGSVNLVVDSDGSGYASLLLGAKAYHTKIEAGDNDIVFDLENGSFLLGFTAGELKSGVITNISFTDRDVVMKEAVSSDSTGGVMFQVGANGSADQRIGMHIDNMASTNLGFTGAGKTLSQTSILTREDANEAIGVIEKSVNQVSSQRAGIGAQINRLGHTINNLENAIENLQAAESSIRDLDMAEEMMEYVKQNILLQAAQAMLAQAMRTPETILVLLRQ